MKTYVNEATTNLRARVQTLADELDSIIHLCDTTLIALSHLNKEQFLEHLVNVAGTMACFLYIIEEKKALYEIMFHVYTGECTPDIAKASIKKLRYELVKVRRLINL